ncbi:MAG: XRE family transcriptional regulator, partial [bacterium]
PQSIPTTERRARHYVELARSADLEGSHEATLHLLQRAMSVSPETVRYSPVAREIAGRLVRSAGAAIRADAVELARAVGASPDLGYAVYH